VEYSYLDKVTKHIEIGEKLGLDDSDVAFSIIHSSEKYSDKEVKDVLSSLSEKIRHEIKAAIESYKETGEYYVISSTGVTKDLSKLMKRLSEIF
jgi:hypothetical protein